MSFIRSLVRRLLCICILVLSLSASLAQAGVTTMLSASNTTGATTAVDTANALYVRVQAWRTDSASAGSCTIYLQLSIDGTMWVNAKTFTNLTGADATTGAGGDGITVPSMNFARLYVAAAGTGTFTVKLDVQR